MKLLLPLLKALYGYRMEATNEMNIIEAVAVNDPVIITDAQILATDYSGDEGAQFYCDFINAMNYFESYLEDPEKLCMPDDDGEIPYITFIEMMNELTGYKWAKRTWGRMEARTAGIEPEERLTQLQKSEHPNYKDWECVYCHNFYKGAKALKSHQERECCQERHTRLWVKGTKGKVPSGKFLHTAMIAEGLLARARLAKSRLAPELEEETISDNGEGKTDPIETCVYVIKTFEYNHTTKAIDYAGLWEESETGNKEFKTEEEARKQFEYATEGDKGYIAVELVEINPDSEIRENVIEEWEDNIDDYINDDDDTYKYICKCCHLRFYDILETDKEKYGDWCRCNE